MSRAASLSRNNTPPSMTARAYGEPTPRTFTRQMPARSPDDLATQNALREGRLLPCAPQDCSFHYGPPRENCQRCGAPWSWYAKGVM